VIRILIVDDEPLARRGLCLGLEGEADLEIVGECADGPDAVTAIRSLRPDLVFLDVQMPGLTGFQVLEEVADEYLPMVVFVTAHDAHALQAFELHALDYLLKPYPRQRLLESLRRARHELSRSDDFPERRRLVEMMALMQAAGLPAESRGERYTSRFMVRDRDRILVVRADNLEAVEAAGNYVQLVEGERKHLLRLTLAEVEEQLDPAKFARIHRSTIIQVDRVRELRPDPHGDCDVLLESGKVYRLSRAYRDRLLPEGGKSGP
jgi:two-component system LytT family response regulator